jgi:O-antigen/teichoic acid export membrane protein
MSAPVIAAQWRRLIGGHPVLRPRHVGAAVGTLSLNLSLKMLTLLANILLARGLGASGYGMYASTMAMLFLLGVPTTLGLPILVIRMLATYRVHRQWGLMRGLLVRANAVVFVLSIIIAGLAALIVWTMARSLPTVQVHTLWWAFAVLPIMALGALRSATLRGLHHVILGQLSENLIAPGTFVLSLAACIYLLHGTSLTPSLAMALQFTAVLAGFAVGTWLLLRNLPEELRTATPGYETRIWVRSAIPLLLLGATNLLNTQTGILMLAAIKGSTAAGLYQAASRGAELVALLLIVVNMVIQPRISSLYAARDMQRLQHVVTLAARVALLGAIPFAFVLIVFGRSILAKVFGPEFAQGSSCMTILCIGQIFNAATGSVGLILNMTGHERDALIGMCVGAATNILLNALLIPRWGIEGAAVATGMGMVAWNVVLVVLVRRRTGLVSTALGAM